MLPSRIKTLLEKLYRTDNLSNVGIDTFELQWQQDRDDGVKVHFNIYLTLVLVFACSSVYVFGSPASRITLISTYVLIVSQMLVLGVRKLNTFWTNHWYYFSLVQAALIGHAVGLAQNIHADVSVAHKMISAAIYMGVVVNMIYMTPFLNGMNFVIGLESILFGMLAWGRYGEATETLSWYGSLFGLVVFVLYMHVLNQRRSVYYAAIQKRSSEIQANNERLRMEALEREINFAKKVQQSLAPSFEILRANHATLSFFERRHGILSGDWMGAKKLTSEKLVVAIADVTGKGIGAAMVAQSLNTLWSEEISTEHFEPQAWLTKVNATLRRLGHKEPYTATMGLAIIGETELEYYSCGHLPIFYSHVASGSRQYGRLLGRGNILGFADDLDLEPVRMSFNEIKAELLLIGTDGVFKRGGITTVREVDKLVRDVEILGRRALDKVDVPDDKLLIWVQRAA